MNCGMELEPDAKRMVLVQVANEIKRPVYVPLVLGNECFVLTLQGKSSFDETRIISWYKLGPNGLFFFIIISTKERSMAIGGIIPIEASIGFEMTMRRAICSVPATSIATVQFCPWDPIQNGIDAQQLLYCLTGCFDGRMEISNKIVRKLSLPSSTVTLLYPFMSTKDTAVTAAVRNRYLQVRSPCQPTKTIPNRSCNAIKTESRTSNLCKPQKFKIMKYVLKCIHIIVKSGLSNYLSGRQFC